MPKSIHLVHSINIPYPSLEAVVAITNEELSSYKDERLEESLRNFSNFSFSSFQSGPHFSFSSAVTILSSPFSLVKDT
jgi:hypothetical protein